MEQRYKVCLACTSTPVTGCEDMSEQEAQAFLWENNGDDVVETECGDTKKYVILLVDANPNEKYS